MNRTLRNIQITRPLVFLDLEATGIDIQRDRIVEIAVARMEPDGGFEVKTRRLNPEMKIPPESTAVHGITDADVADAPTFKSISASLLSYLDGCDLAGFNVAKFDIPMLRNEFTRAGINFGVEGRRIIDAQSIYHKMEPRTLEAAVKFFCGKGHETAHSAEGDVLATIDVFEAQLERYADLPKDLDALAEFCTPMVINGIDKAGRFRWSGDGEPVITFGPHSGSSLKELAVENPKFLAWMLQKDFPDDTKKIAKDALAGVFPVRS